MARAQKYVNVRGRDSQREAPDYLALAKSRIGTQSTTHANNQTAQGQALHHSSGVSKYEAKRRRLSGVAEDAELDKVSASTGKREVIPQPKSVASKVSVGQKSDLDVERASQQSVQRRRSLNSNATASMKSIAIVDVDSDEAYIQLCLEKEKERSAQRRDPSPVKKSVRTQSRQSAVPMLPALN